MDDVDRNPPPLARTAPNAGGAAFSPGQIFERDKASQALEIRLVRAGPGLAVLAMTVSEPMLNAHGTCHGGCLFTLADAAFAVAGNSHGGSVVAAGAEIQFLAPVALNDHLQAVASERVLSGSSGIYDVTITRDQDHQVVAEFRGRSRAAHRSAGRTIPA